MSGENWIKKTLRDSSIFEKVRNQHMFRVLRSFLKVLNFIWVFTWRKTMSVIEKSETSIIKGLIILLRNLHDLYSRLGETSSLRHCLWPQTHMKIYLKIFNQISVNHTVKWNRRIQTRFFKNLKSVYSPLRIYVG